MPSRRTFLTSVLAAAVTPQLTWADAGGPAYVAAARERDGSFALHGLAASGADVFRIPLPARGHAGAAHPSAPEAVAFARRPGDFALVIDCARGRLLRRLSAPAGRHFYGHGVFVAGGDILATSENEIETGEGCIGLWSRPDGYARIGEFASGGIGPHEITSLPGDVLVVANGGIRTDPARGRDKLNIDTMRPNLAYLDTAGRLLDLVELDPKLRLNSIRHLAVRPDGLVAFAMQWQGDPFDAVPLLGLHRRGAPPILAAAGPGEQVAMQGYAGSIAFDGTGARVGITSPGGGRLHLFAPQGAFVATLARADVCGLATADDGLVASDGHGAILRLDGARLRPIQQASCAWDNHLVAI